jgi:hypothetical protein
MGFKLWPMTPRQCSAARGALQWSYKKLAVKAKLHDYRFVSRFEKGVDIQSSAYKSIRASLEKAGVRFGSDGRSISWTDL